MRTRLLIVLGWLALSLPGQAQDEAREEAPEAPAEGSPRAAEQQNTEDMEDESTDESAVVDEFIFSEEIPADEQLVFPVDI